MFFLALKPPTTVCSVRGPPDNMISKIMATCQHVYQNTHSHYLFQDHVVQNLCVKTVIIFVTKFSEEICAICESHELSLFFVLSSGPFFLLCDKLPQCTQKHEYATLGKILSMGRNWKHLRFIRDRNITGVYIKIIFIALRVLNDRFLFTVPALSDQRWCKKL